MDNLSKQQSALLEATMEYCERILDRLKQISIIVEEENRKINSNLYVDISNLNKLKEEARILKKRICENLATINFMSEQISLDDEYYESYINKVNRNATHISNSLFNIINRNEMIARGATLNGLTAIFRNNGYHSLNPNNAVLKVSIYNDAIQVRNTQEFYMEQGTVANTGEIVEFSINNLSIPEIKSVYNVELTLFDPADNYVYCSVKESGLDVVNPK